jgi:hypothetical protein
MDKRLDKLQGMLTTSENDLKKGKDTKKCPNGQWQKQEVKKKTYRYKKDKGKVKHQGSTQGAPEDFKKKNHASFETECYYYKDKGH